MSLSEPKNDIDKVRQHRTFVDGCSLCESIGKGGFGPAHDASESCESGKHEHCTCDTCF